MLRLIRFQMFLFCLIVIPVQALATCTGSTPNWICDAGTVTELDDLMNNNSPAGFQRGDTVTVTATGAVAWGSTLNIEKGVNLIGPGMDNLTISRSNTLLHIEADQTTRDSLIPIRVSGFTFSGNNANIYLVTIGPGENTLPSNIFRKLIIDNNRFKNCSGRILEQQGQIRGVIHSNIFDRIGILWTAMGDNIQDDWDDLTFSYGSEDNLYFEDNSILFSSSCSFSDSGWIESGQGGRVAVRYNTWDYTNSTGSQELWDIHGSQYFPGGSFSTMVAEYYGNIITNTRSGLYRWVHHRGSWGMYLNNRVSGNQGGLDMNISAYEDGCDSDVPGTFSTVVQNTYFVNNWLDGEIWPATILQNYCSLAENTNFWNYNASCTASSCTAGIGTGSSIPTGTCTNGTGYWVTSYSPASTPPETMADMRTYTQAGDFYKCVGGSWVKYYEPYTYPHPLRAEGGDTTAPTVNITTGNSNIVADSLYVYGTSEDIVGVTLCKYRIGAAPTDASGVTTTGTTSWNATTTGYSQGANTLYVGCRDAAGNWGTDTITVNRDSVAPTVTITSPTSSATYGTSSPTITLGGTSSSDTASVAYSNAAGGSGSCTGTTSWTCSNITLTSGSGNVITVTGTDAFSNQGTDIITVTYTPPDTTPPSVTITTTDPTNTSLSTQEVAWNASDAVGVTSCKWRIGSAPDAFNGTTDGSSPATISGYAVGANTVYIGCTDAAGNWGSDSLTINYAPPGGSGCYIQGGKAQ